MERGHLRHERAAVTPPPRRSRRSRVWMLQTLGVRAPCVHLTLAGFPALKVKTHRRQHARLPEISQSFDLSER